MKESKAFLLLAVVCAVLIIGVAYAAITNVNFTLTGNATAAPAQENFVVAFGKVGETGAPTFTGSTGVNVDFGTPSDTTATMVVTGLKKVGDTATATFTVLNKSTDLKAKIVLPEGRTAMLDATKAASDYITVTVSELVNTVIDKESSTTFTVTVELIKLPVANDVTATIDVAFQAAAVEL